MKRLILSISLVFIAAINPASSQSQDVNQSAVKEGKPAFNSASEFNPEIAKRVILPLSRLEQLDQQNRQACAQSLCGMPNRSESMLFDQKALNKAVKSGAIKLTIEYYLRKIIEVQRPHLENEKQILGLLKQKIGTGSLPVFEDKQEIRRLFFNPYLTVTIEKEQPVHKKVKVSLNNRTEKLSKTDIQAIQDYATMLEFKENHDPEATAVGLLLNDEEKLHIATDFLNFIAKTYHEAKESGALKKSYLEALAQHYGNIKRKFENPKTKKFIFWEIRDDVTRIKHFFLANGLAQNNHLGDDCETPACIAYIHSQLNSRESLNHLAIYEDRLTSKVSLENEAKTCLQGLVSDYMTRHKAPSPELARARFRSSIEGFLKQVRPLFSTDAYETIEKKMLNDLNFRTDPRDRDEIKGTFSDYFSEWSQELQQEFEPNKSSKSDEDTMSLLSQMYFKVRDINSNQIFASCPGRELMASFMSTKDVKRAKNPDTSELFLNYLTIPDRDIVFLPTTSEFLNMDTVELVMRHEFGHALSAFLEAEETSGVTIGEYEKVKQCITQKYTDKYNIGNSDYFVGEAMADYIAYFNSPKNEIQTCALLDRNTSTNKYTNLDLILNDFHKDSHNTELGRVLTEAIDKNVDLPLSCRAVIDRYFMKQEKSSCSK